MRMENLISLYVYYRSSGTLTLGSDENVELEITTTQQQQRVLHN